MHFGVRLRLPAANPHAREFDVTKSRRWPEFSTNKPCGYVAGMTGMHLSSKQEVFESQGQSKTASVMPTSCRYFKRGSSPQQLRTWQYRLHDQAPRFRAEEKK
jgi:hypothetical protein